MEVYVDSLAFEANIKWQLQELHLWAVLGLLHFSGLEVAACC